MGNCLLTQLKESVQNDNLPVLGKINIKVAPVTTPTATTQRIRFYKGVAGTITLDIVGDGYFVSSDPGSGHWSDGTNSTGKSAQITGTAWKEVLVSNIDCEILMGSKYDSLILSAETNAGCAVNINDFNFMADRLADPGFTSNYNTVGDVAEFLRLRPANANTSLLLYNTSVTLDLKDLLNDDITCNLTTVNLGGCRNVTNKDSATIAAIREKWPNINISV